MPAKSDISKANANSETLETKDDNEEYGHYDDIHDKLASAFGECTSANEQMCCEWNQASLDQDCGP